MAWTCKSCDADLSEQLFWCDQCGTSRYSSYAVMVAEHVLEHLAAGINEPIEVLKALQQRPIKAYSSLTLSFVAQQMRLLTKDTTMLARDIAKARAARVMLEVLVEGDAKDKIAVLKGIQVLGDVVEHRGEVTTRFVVETHEGAPPRRDADVGADVPGGGAQ